MCKLIYSYLKKFPAYILRKAKLLNVSKHGAEKMIETFKVKEIEQRENSLSTFNKNLKKAIDYDPKENQIP